MASTGAGTCRKRPDSIFALKKYGLFRGLKTFVVTKWGRPILRTLLKISTKDFPVCDKLSPFIFIIYFILFYYLFQDLNFDGHQYFQSSSQRTHQRLHHILKANTQRYITITKFVPSESACRDPTTEVILAVEGWGETFECLLRQR